MFRVSSVGLRVKGFELFSRALGHCRLYKSGCIERTETFCRT